MQFITKSRWMVLSALVATAPFSVGCAQDEVSEVEEASTDDITSTANLTAVKRQSIGNCWLYAVASWVEGLEKAATKTEDNYSESYWTFWHWFEQLANGYGSPTEISTGGSYNTAAGLIDRYGMMLEKDFIPEEATSEMSNRQSSALNAMNAWLKSGALTAPTAPKRGTPEYRKFILRQLETAWGLSADRSKKIETVFGVSVSKTIDKSFVTKKPYNQVIRARDVLAAIPDLTQSTTTKVVINPKLTVQDAIGSGSGWSRSGTHAWREVTFPSGTSGRRSFFRQAQRSLHDGVPVVVSWFVDFNALTSEAHFSKAAVDAKGVGRQGGHMTAFVDYTAQTADGKLFPAGQDVTDPATVAKLLDPTTTIVSIRVKNSWGAYRPDRWAAAQLPGYHDLDADYVNGPLKRCEEKNGTADPTNCSDDSGMQDMVISPIYLR